MLKEAKKVIKVFSHCGWVNGLNEEQYVALNDLRRAVGKIGEPKKLSRNNKRTAKKLRDQGLTIREIASVMGYKHPGSVFYLLTQ